MITMANFQEENLQDELKKRDILIEKQKQEIHELQMCLRAKTALEEDMKFELQSLQEELQQQKNVLGEELAKMKAAFRQELKEKVYELNIQLEEKVSQTVQLERQVEELSQCKAESKSNDGEVAALQAELQEAKKEMSEMAQTIETLDLKHEKACRQLAQAAEELEEMQRQYSHSKQSYGALREENTNIKEKLEQVQEELQGLQMELMTLRHEAKASQESAEEVAKRGNSLFSEVEDNRQAAVARLKEAAEETARAKREMLIAKNEAQMLRVQNATLHNQWENINKTSLEYMDSALKERHDEYIKKLEKKISTLESELVRKAAFLPDCVQDMHWVQKLRIDHQKDINNLESKLRLAELKLFFSEEGKLRYATTERSLTAQNMKLEGQIRELKLQLESITINKESAASSNEQVDSPAPSTISPADAFLERLRARGQPKSVQIAQFKFFNSQNQENVRPKKMPVSATTTRMPNVTLPADDLAK